LYQAGGQIQGKEGTKSIDWADAGGKNEVFDWNRSDMKAAIFDLDGTLVDTLADLTDSMNYALVSLGQKPHSELVTRMYIGDGVFTFASRALPPDAQGLVPDVVARMREHYRQNCLNKTRAFPGMVEAITELKKRGIKVAVLTNKDQNAARRITEHYYGKGLFDEIVGVVDKTPVKPEAIAATKLMAELGVGKAEAFMVGDSGIDMATAKATGIMGIGVTWGFRDREELLAHGAAVVVDSAKELVEKLSR
jgi:phosphoglycolate phosphatase